MAAATKSEAADLATIHVRQSKLPFFYVAQRKSRDMKSGHPDEIFSVIMS